MDKISSIKGFEDHLPAEARLFTFMSDTARTVFSSYGYREIHVPILEYTELFARSIGAETDVVQKEMFTFADRKDRSLTMRPEATAGIMRAYIQHSIHSQESLSKYFSFGPMFRYERPQKGRLRQFHQMDCECLGGKEPHLDAEVVLMLMQALTAMGLKDLSLEINTLGCRNCRPAYRELLIQYLRSQPFDEFCEDCRRRMETSPLRVLDCKHPRCRELTTNAPKLADYVCDECKEHFSVVLRLLDAQKLPYRVNNRLVRGLDYYMRTTFEVVSGNIGSQSSVAGGGRYDGLVESLGGPAVPGIGFACGMERLALLLPEREAFRPDFYIAVLDPAALDEALILAQRLRSLGYTGECAFKSGSPKSQLRQASKNGARYALILGGDELANDTVLVKNLESGEQTEQSRATLVNLD